MSAKHRTRPSNDLHHRYLRLQGDVAQLSDEVTALRAENARLVKLAALRDKVVDVAKELIDGDGWATGRTLDRLLAAFKALAAEESK